MRTIMHLYNPDNGYALDVELSWEYTPEYVFHDDMAFAYSHTSKGVSYYIYKGNALTF